jgi:HAD superfamily hydrolase (TIGR01458 family)
VQLVGEEAEAVLLGGADETDEPNRVFSYMNLARAFAELEAGADLYCLHKNRWWQTSRGPLLDSGAFIAGLEYAAEVEATVLGKPSPAFFGAALDALDADPERTWMVGDDLEADIAGAKSVGLRTVLVRTGKFREQALADSLVKPDAVVDSLGDVPGLLARE